MDGEERYANMTKVDKAEILLYAWIRLDEIKNLLSAVEKGLEEETEWEVGKIHGIISIIKRELEGLIKEIDQVV